MSAQPLCVWLRASCGPDDLPSVETWEMASRLAMQGRAFACEDIPAGAVFQVDRFEGSEEKPTDGEDSKQS